MSAPEQALPGYDEIVAAAQRLAGKAVRTPLLTSPVLNERLNAQVFFKAECLQRTGSFKFRGAYNALSQMHSSAAETGVLACSSGNHAQGIAEAARLFGYPATIVMPADAPQSKKDRTRRSGAVIVEYDRQTEDREAIMMDLARQRNAPFIHPYDNADVIAGQGTCGLEICDELENADLAPDRVLVCTGGGGLLAGITMAVKDRFPGAKIHTVEPEGYDDQARSHATGERLGVENAGPSLCDAILTPSPGALSFAICQGQLEQGLVVSDDEALAAVAFAYHELKLVVEPGGAVTLAALLAGKIAVAGETVVCTLSGGNIDPPMMARALKG